MMMGSGAGSAINSSKYEKVGRVHTLPLFKSEGITHYIQKGKEKAQSSRDPSHLHIVSFSCVATVTIAHVQLIAQSSAFCLCLESFVSICTVSLPTVESSEQLCRIVSFSWHVSTTKNGKGDEQLCDTLKAHCRWQLPSQRHRIRENESGVGMFGVR